MMKSSPKKYLISLQLAVSSNATKDPDIVVTINQNSCTPTFKKDNIIEYEMLGILGENLITIQLTNKEYGDTIVDSSGNIIEDINAQISRLEIDGIDVTYYARNKNVYITDDGVINETFGFMHKNGTMSLSVTCPGFYFLRNTTLIK